MMNHKNNKNKKQENEEEEGNNTNTIIITRRRRTSRWITRRKAKHDNNKTNLFLNSEKEGQDHVFVLSLGFSFFDIGYQNHLNQSPLAGF